MKQFIKAFIYEMKAARSLRMSNKSNGYVATYWYQRYVHYTNLLVEMEEE